MFLGLIMFLLIFAAIIKSGETHQRRVKSIAEAALAAIEKEENKKER